MEKVWVKEHSRADGTKVKGHWRYYLGDTEENKVFKRQNPGIRSRPIKITKEIRDAVKKWKENALHPRDKETLKYLSKKDHYPPIIVHQYGKTVKIIDGWHRVYDATKKKKQTIKAFKKKY